MHLGNARAEVHVAVENRADNLAQFVRPLELWTAPSSGQFVRLHFQVVCEDKPAHRAGEWSSRQCTEESKLPFQEDIAKHGRADLCKHVCISDSAVICRLNS